MSENEGIVIRKNVASLEQIIDMAKHYTVYMIQSTRLRLEPCNLFLNSLIFDLYKRMPAFCFEENMIRIYMLTWWIHKISV